MGPYWGCLLIGMRAWDSRRNLMAASSIRILVIGKPSSFTGLTLVRLSDCGWGFYTVENLRDARELLKTFQIDVVLAAESLSDGRGYDIAETIARQTGTLLVGVALSENSLWLPVIDRGTRVLGSRAIGAKLLEAELVRVLTKCADARGAEPVAHPLHALRRSAPQHGIPPKRKRPTASAA
jgi:hypothetical protein